MSDVKFPYLCGGVLFLLLNEAKKPDGSRKKRLEGIKHDHSAPRMTHDLICALRRCGAIADEEIWSDNAFKKEVSLFQNCKSNKSLNLPFDQEPFYKAYDQMVKEAYNEAINKMQKFADTHLDENKCVWLVKAILCLIERDSGISDSDHFFITCDGIPKTKNEMRSMDSFHVSAVLVGVMHYILLNRRNNKAGLETLDRLSKKEDRKPRVYTGDDKVDLERSIVVTVGAIEEVNESKQSVALPTNAEGHTESEQDDELPINADEVTESGQDYELPSKIECPSERDQKLYVGFRDDCESILEYIIQHDPLGGPTDCLLPDRIEALCDDWHLRAMKIQNKTIRDTLYQTLDLLGQYHLYLSDEFLRFVENQGFLLFRNQSAEDVERNERIMGPKTSELRHAIYQQYQKLNNFQDNDCSPIDATSSDKKADERIETAIQ